MNDVPFRWVTAAGSNGGARLAFALTAVAVVAAGSPPAGLIAGILYSVGFANPYPRASHALAKRLLQLCVVLLGFGMDLSSVVQAGRSGVVFAASSIGATLLLGLWLGKRLSVNRRTTALISVGTAICGGSAIAAVGSVVAVGDGEIAVAIGTVFLLNAAALYVFPLLGHALHLTQAQFGFWSGIAIHDISSVVGAAMSYGPESLRTATAVKLSRTLWIVPVTLTFAMRLGEKRSLPARAESGAVVPRARVAIPWFIGLFLIASFSRSLFPALISFGPGIARFSHLGMTLVLFLIGASLSLRSIRALGWRAVVLGIALWIFISAISLAAIRLSHVGA